MDELSVRLGHDFQDQQAHARDGCDAGCGGQAEGH